MKRSLTPALAALVLAAASLQAQVPAGGEFRVNTYSTGHQYFPAAAFDRAGDFVVIWSSYEGSVRLTEVKGQRYAADGVRAGAEFIVNATTSGFQYTNQVGTPVAMRPDGRFVVVWSNVAAPGVSDIRAQRFEANGVRAGAELQVNGGASGSSYYPNVAIAAHGTFVVVWAGDTSVAHDVFGQRFDATGNRLGKPFRANSSTAGVQTAPRVAMDADGSFVVVWQDRNGRDGSSHGVFGQRFARDGARVGAEFQVNTFTTGNQFAYGVACAADGRFAVSWDRAGDGNGFGVFAQRHDATGAPDGSEFLVNQATAGEQIASAIASDQQSNFVTTWQSTTADGSGYGIRAQRFDSAGARRGVEFRVNTYTTLSQNAANVAVDGVGNFVVTWQSDRQDGSDLGVFAQRFGGLHPTALRVDRSGNGVLEPGEVAEALPTWRNANGAPQTVTGGLGSATGPPGGAPTILDPVADYGTLAPNAAAECNPCYRVAIPNPPQRPAAHWDGFVLESIAPDAQGQRKSWALHVGGTFTDVSAASPFYPFIESLVHHGVTGGCAFSTPDAYCPLASTTREQMAPLLLVAKEGAGYTPPPCTGGMFEDVPPTSPFCPWIEELARRGAVTGCTRLRYCPHATVTREEIAVMVLATLDPSLSPPPCVPPNVYGDVPETSAYCRWIEELANRGVVSDCGGGNYCPTAAVTRDHMAYFIAATFGLALYGP